MSGTRKSAKKLWARIPAVYRQYARFSTDAWDARSAESYHQHRQMFVRRSQVARVESNDSTAYCDNAVHVLYERPFHFQRNSKTTCLRRD
jgi:hypothetical protein